MMTMYNPEWYKATAKQDIQAGEEVIKAGRMLYYTPSAERGKVIVFDGRRAIRILLANEVGTYLEAQKNKRAVPESNSIDARYMEAAVGG